MKTIVVGGGIGGLTVAVALARRGHEVSVFERAPVFTGAGTALSLWPNALRALDALGLGDAVRDRACLGAGGGIQSASGRRFRGTDLGPVQGRYGPVAVVRRSDLIEILHDALPAGIVHKGVEVTGVRHGTVQARTHAVHAELIVGADGIRSLVRRSLWPDPPAPRYAGYTAWRTIVPVQVEEAVETWGRGARFGYAPLPRGHAYAFASVDAEEGAPDEGVGGLRRRFGGWPDPIGALLDAMDDRRLLHDDLYELPPLGTFTEGDAVLVGDAAHAMTPDLGQGAGQALEDAVVFAATGPAAYDEGRRKRTQMIARRSRLAGRSASCPRWPVCATSPPASHRARRSRTHSPRY